MCVRRAMTNEPAGRGPGRLRVSCRVTVNSAVGPGMLGARKREREFWGNVDLPVKVASSEHFKMVKVGLSWDEFKMLKILDPLENQPPPYAQEPPAPRFISARPGRVLVQ